MIHDCFSHRLFLFLVFALGILSLPARDYVGDPYTWREESRSLILRHQLSVPAELTKDMGDPGQFYVQNPKNGRYYSKYGLMNSLLNTIPLGAEKLVTKELPPFGSDHRLLFLGVFSVLLSVVLAHLLWSLAGLYTESAAAAAAFVGLCFLATFLLHYLRAANSECTQVVFFTAYFLNMARYRASGFRSLKWLERAWMFLLCLVLTKTVFLLLLPLSAAALLLAEWRLLQKPLREAFRGALGGSLFPAAGILLVIGLVNWVKFGSPFLSGYHAWKREDLSQGSDLLAGLRGLLLSEQWGVVTHFPLLLLALPAFPRFRKKFPFDAWLALGIFVAFLLVIARLPIWKGEWGYGPRYLLFVLPVLSLPALLLLADLRARLPGAQAVAALAVIAALFGFSGFLQFQMERVDPFFVYWVRPGMSCVKDARVERHFSRRHYALLQWEILRQREHPELLWFSASVKKDCPESEYTEYLSRMRDWSGRGNFLFWSRQGK